MTQKHTTFGQYLLDESESGHTEFRVVIENRNSDGSVKIYIHPFGKDGDSRNFEVSGIIIIDVTKWLPEPGVLK